MPAQKSLNLGDRIKDHREHTSRIAGTLTAAHHRREHFTSGVAGIPLVDQYGALSDGSVVKDDRRAHVHQILKRVKTRWRRLFGTAGRRRLRYRSYKTANQSNTNNAHEPYLSRYQKCLAVVDGCAVASDSV
jgi:hypothetical protein